jgi:hypothetical protein
MHKSSVPLVIERQVKDLGNQIARARIFYDLWWQVQGEPIDQHLDGMNLYPDFFRFSRHAYLYAMIVQTMLPFDERRDTLSFKTIIKDLNKNDATKAAALAADRVVSNCEGIWRKLKVVRGECFAHRSRIATYDDVWKRAAIRPQDIHQAQSLAMDAVNILAGALGLGVIDHHLSPGEEAARLLKSLQAIAADTSGTLRH